MARLIRLAAAGDGAAIAEIYRPHVADSWVSFEEDPPDGDEMARRLAGPLHPWLVIEEDGHVIGYASTGPMRGRPAYRWSVETGIYLAAAAQGRGLGRTLMAAHLDLLERQGFVTAIAGIGLPNDASIALHRKCGFSLYGIERQVGFKNGRWVDVSRWQRDLAQRRDPPDEPLPFAGLFNPR